MKGWTILILFLIVPSVLGLGVAQDYLEDDTLRLMNGETHYLKIILQNPEDVDVPVSISVNSEVVEIFEPKEYYNLSAKSYDNVIYLKITAPKDGKIGDKYEVTYSVSPYKSQEGGMVGLNMKITRKFYVLIVDENGVGSNKKEIFGGADTGLILRIAVIVLVILFIIMIGALLARKSSAITERIYAWKLRKKIRKENKLLFKKEITKKKVVMKKPDIKKNPIKKEEKIVKRPSINTSFIEKASSTNLYFRLKNGTILRSILDLYHYLHIMPVTEFSHHVNGRKNDFAKWVGDVFSKKELSTKMKKCKTREEMRKVIKYEMDK